MLIAASGCGRPDAAILSVSDPPPTYREAAVTPAPADGCASDIVLGPGLSHERRPLATASKSPDGATPCLDIVRADLATYQLRILTGARDGNGSHPAPWWRDTFKLIAVTNAGMFHEGGNPVGLLIEDGAQLGSDNKTFSGYLAFDPVVPNDSPRAMMTGRDCPGFDLKKLRTQYRSIVQSSRLLNCDGAALPWKDAKKYSTAAIAVDRKGQVVFLHVRDAVTMTDLSAALADPSLDLDLAGAIFLEGGPEASLVVRGPKGELSRMGSYETGFVENDGNQSFWWLPNVIALETR